MLYTKKIMQWRGWERRVALLLLLVVVFFPVATPVFEQNKDDTGMAVHKDASLQQDFAIPSRTLAGLDIPLRESENVPHDTLVRLTIRHASGERHIEETFSRLFVSDRLRFRFFPLWLQQDEQISFTLEAPSLSPRKPLTVLRFSEGEPQEGMLHFRAYAARPFLWSLASRILTTPTQGTDIALTYQEGGVLLEGQNPYQRIHASNLRDNASYATYLPSFYLLSALSQRLGLSSFEAWISFWRPVFLLFALGTASLLATLFWRKKLFLLALLAGLFFLFNRWSLYVASVGLFDFIPIFFLALSLIVVKQRPYLALALLGISLSFRHIGAILLPLYLIELGRSGSIDQRGKKILFGLISAVAVPLIVSLPFMVHDFGAFIKTLAFSLTRAPVTHFTVPSVDAFLELLGIPAKAGLVILLALMFFSFAKKYTPMYLSSLLVFVIFLDFHSVWFGQYMAYATPLFILTVYEYQKENNRRTSS